MCKVFEDLYNFSTSYMSQATRPRTEKWVDESESLKALLAERDAEIASLNETIEANAKQAEFDAAVDAKVAERLAEQGVEVASATPKSLSPVPTDVLTKDSTSHDPQPQVSKGMAHLGAWLEGRLGGRRLE